MHAVLFNILKRIFRWNDFGLLTAENEISDRM